MKLVSTYIFVIVLFLSVKLQAQDAIAVSSNDNVTTTLFFPSNIVKVIKPAVNFNFQYEQGTNMGLLKARRGKSSNLLVITELGNIYSFALSYSEQVQKYHFILKANQAVGQLTSDSFNRNNDNRTSESGQLPLSEIDESKVEVVVDASVNNDTFTPTNNEKENQSKVTNAVDSLEKPIVNPSDDTVINSIDEIESDSLYDIDREEYYQIYCQNNYLQKVQIKRCFKKHKKISLRLNNILVDRNEKYFILQIENNSKSEYKVDGLSFFKKTNEGLEKIMSPLYTFNLQEVIAPGSINELVYVFRKFDLTNKELVTVVLLEVESGNLVELPLNHLYVNSPSN